MRPIRIFRTIGFRLAAMYAALFGLSVVFLFAVSYWITGHALRQQLAANVDAEVSSLVADATASGTSHAADSIRRRIASRLHPTTYYLILDSAGRELAGNLTPRAPHTGWQRLSLSAARIAADRELEPEDLAEHSLMALGAKLPDGSFLMVGADTFRISEVEEAIVRAFSWAFGITIVLAATGGTLLSFGFLRRVDAINRTSRAIIDGRLADRIPTRGTDDELDRLALNLNEMLDRVQALLDSLRQVSNDIAHDLRTPLSRLRQQLEGARINARSVAEYEAAVDTAIADTDAILQTFGALLRIAQIEAGTRRSAFSVIDLSTIFQSIVDAYTAVAEDSGRSMSATIASGVECLGDRELLTQMLANLVENAIRHTADGTPIQVALENGPAGPVGIVADRGPGIAPEYRDQVFKRFYRLEQSRSTSGSGLGMALVTAIAELHGISVSLDDNDPGLLVRLTFPAPEG